MSHFTVGAAKTARVPLKNPTIKAFDYEGVIYMGAALAEMSRQSFHLNAGEEKQISFPVVMPATPGVYPVYIGVWVAGETVELHRATEDVTIVGVAQFSYVSAIRQTRYVRAFLPVVLMAEIDVKNTSSVAGVCMARPQYARPGGEWKEGSYFDGVPESVLQATIQPDQTVTFRGSFIDEPYYGHSCKLRFTGDPGTTAEVPMF